jgi:acyl-CoA synthetase (AMP-forming)/AMP-acid ligase II
VVGLLATLAAGACLVLDGRFSRRGFWLLIEQRQITWINAVPAIITVLAMDPPAVRPAGAAGRIRFVRSASAPLPPSALRRFEEAQAAERVLPGSGAAGGTHRQGRPAPAAGTGHGRPLASR